MMNGFNEEKNNVSEDEYLYKSVMEGKKKSRIWSLVSLICSIVSLLCCCIPLPGAVLGVLAVVFAVVSRLNIGYFDGLAIAGLIVGIFGLVFSVSMMVLYSTDWYKDIFLKAFEEGMKDGLGSDTDISI